MYARPLTIALSGNSYGNPRVNGVFQLKCDPCPTILALRLILGCEPASPHIEAGEGVTGSGNKLAWSRAARGTSGNERIECCALDILRAV